MRRVAWIALTLLLAVIVAVGALVAVLTLRGLPSTTGTLALAGLDGSVTVSRDAAGIAWIEATTSHDLFYAQGYVHAQERMWQMEVWRHISAGRLSELFGASTLEEDKFIRTLGWRQAAERDLAALAPDARAALEAYSAGVNAWIGGHDGALSLPFVVTGLKAGLPGGIGGYHLEPWTPLDSLAWQKVQAWQLGGNYDREVFRMLADAKLGDPARTDQLFPPYDPKMPIITPTGLKGSGGAGASATTAAAVTESGAATATAGSTLLAPLDSTVAAGWRDVADLGAAVLRTAGLDAGAGIAGDHQVGSNDFVVAPSKSRTKSALLANDPHLGIGMPSVWFINGLRCRTVSKACPFDVVGVTFPGVPGIILGHNAAIAWGATNVDPDVEDLFQITPTADGNGYRAGPTTKPFRVRHETIQVAGGPPVDLTVRETDDGPILNDVDSRLKDAPLLALRWTATDRVDGTFLAIFRLATAANFDEFRAALRTYGAPSQNFVYADVNGHIGYVLPGAIPIRADPADDGERVRPGDGKHDWKGTIPFDDLPWQLDPPSGLIVTANNAPVDGKYPYLLGRDWDPGFRAERIGDLLRTAIASGGVTTDTLREIQADTTVLRASTIVPFALAVHPSTEAGALVQQQIADWHDDACQASSIGCTAYQTFEYRLVRGLFDDELGALAREYVGGGAPWQATVALLRQPASPWWDDVTTTDRVETRDDIVAAALDEAGKELKAAYGADVSGWTWGAVHTARFEEATLGTSGIGPLEWYFDKGPFPAPGAAGAINNTYYRPSRAYPDPEDPAYRPVGIDGVFDVTNLPSYRLSIDMADLDHARIIQTTGQSGNPFDPHYGDMIPAWLAGDTVPLWWTPESRSRETVKTLTLSPGG